MKHRFVFVMACLVPAIGLVAVRADEGPAVAKRLSEAGVILPLEEILAAVRKAKPGEVLETELERKGQGYVYEIEILDARGQVWEVELDAKTGKLIELESDD